MEKQAEESKIFTAVTTSSKTQWASQINKQKKPTETLSVKCEIQGMVTGTDVFLPVFIDISIQTLGSIWMQPIQSRAATNTLNPVLIIAPVDAQILKVKLSHLPYSFSPWWNFSPSFSSAVSHTHPHTRGCTRSRTHIGMHCGSHFSC